jgi:putative salt-induced outer membrane protein YdiY
VFVGSSAPVAAHEKTDVVVLNNGDRLTGEIKGLSQAILKLDTDAGGTLSLEWTHIAGLTSSFDYQVEVTSGERYFGSLQTAAKPGELKIIGAEATTTVELSDVFQISPLGRNFWKKLNGNINLGFSYTKSNEAVQYTLEAATHYQNRRYLGLGQLNSIFNTQEGADSTRQQYFGFRISRILKKVSGAYGVFQLQSNPDQGYNLRSVFGGGYDRFMIHRESGYLIVNAGLVYDREQVVGSSRVDNSAEAVLGLQIANYTADHPNRTITLGFDTYTNVTDTPRFRAQLNFSLTWEIISNFNIGISLIDSYDSRPPTVEAESNDMSLSISVGYTY